MCSETATGAAAAAIGRTTEEDYFIGVDVGTGSVRACVIDKNGDLLAFASHETQTWQSQPGCYEQSTTDIWKSICSAVRQAIVEAAIAPDAVRSVAFAATCSLAVLAQDTNEPVSVVSPAFTEAEAEHNVLLWMHRAAVAEAQSINATNHTSIRYLGGSVSPLMALSKVLWLKNHMSAHHFDRCRFLDLHDALAFIATGGETVDSADKSLSLGFGIDGTIKGWTPDLLTLIGLNELADHPSRFVGGLYKDATSPLVGARIGSLCERAAQDLGLTTNVLVAAGTIDSYAGWIGTVGADVSTASLNLNFPPQRRLALVAGTSACHILASERSSFVNGVWGPYEDFLLQGTYVYESGQNAVGRLVDYIVQTHPAYQKVRALSQELDVTVFDYLNQLLHEMRESLAAPNITYLGRHLFFYGDFYGNRSPIADPTMSGAIVGLNGGAELEDLAVMYYSALEFLALQTRHILTAMNKSDHAVSAIFLSGSMCLNPIYIELLSTACDIPVVIPEYVKAAVCYGSGLLAAHATSQTKEDLWSMMKRMSKPGRVTMPSRDQYMKGLLDVKYTVFLEQAERQRVFRRMIDSVSNNNSIEISDSS